MIGHLDRVAQIGAEGTLGLLEFGELRQWWLEPPWSGGGAGSRIRPGHYRLERHTEGRFAGSWALVGGGVEHYWAPGCERTAIVIHAGNRIEDTRGCPLPGLRAGFLRGRLAVLDSRAALGQFLALLDPKGDHRLEIRDRLGGWGLGR